MSIRSDVNSADYNLLQISTKQYTDGLTACFETSALSPVRANKMITAHVRITTEPPPHQLRSCFKFHQLY